jgi:hypothetical protein
VISYFLVTTIRVHIFAVPTLVEKPELKSGCHPRHLKPLVRVHAINARTRSVYSASPCSGWYHSVRNIPQLVLCTECNDSSSTPVRFSNVLCYYVSSKSRSCPQAYRLHSVCSFASHFRPQGPSESKNEPHERQFFSLLLFYFLTLVTLTSIVTGT